MDQLGTFIPLILIVVVFWLLIVRPQRKRARDLASTQSALAPGAEVMLTSGIYGRVASLDEQTVHLEVAAGTTLKVARRAVVEVVEPDTQQPAEPLDYHDPASEQQ